MDILKSHRNYLLNPHLFFKYEGLVLNTNLIPNNYPFYYLLLWSVFITLFSILTTKF